MLRSYRREITARKRTREHSESNGCKQSIADRETIIFIIFYYITIYIVSIFLSVRDANAVAIIAICVSCQKWKIKINYKLALTPTNRF